MYAARIDPITPVPASDPRYTGVRGRPLPTLSCPVTVHQFANATLGVSYQGRLLARYDSNGGLLPAPAAPNKVRAATAQRPGRPKNAVPAAAMQRTARTQNPHFFARTPKPGESAGEKMSLTTNPQTHP